MSGNCDKMLLIPSTTNQCPQQMIDGNKVSMGGTSNNRVMEKVGAEIVQQQQQQEALNCPRCDSSNTKFCYYNNYSLSQPRHFCKACKRYWTRGGTLRNVPVGGGCRKNKRLKRPLTTIHTSNSNSNSSSSAPTTTSQSHIDTASTSNHINPFFYGLLPNDHVSVTLPFPTRFNSSRISTSVGYNDLQTLGLGFSSQIMSNEAIDTNNNILVSSYYNSNIFGSSSTSSCTTTTTPALSSLLNSTLLQQKFINGGVKEGVESNSFQQQGLATLENLQVESNCSEMVASKDVKVEIGENNNRVEWNCQNQIQHVGLYDPNSLYWNNNTTTSTGVWNDQATTIGPSVTSLI